MRWRVLLATFGLCTVGGCALVSGLDGLQVGVPCEGGDCVEAGVDAGRVDGAMDGAIDGALDAPRDAPRDVAVPGVSCASSSCTGAQVCCRSVVASDAGDAASTVVFACAATCPNPIDCDGPGDCSGQSCCASGGSAACKTNCTGQEDEVCTQGGPACGGAKSCLPAPAGLLLPPGYRTCQ